jgi:tetratricopeptide (TPR) repeat protein
MQFREQAKAADPEYVFPFQPEAILPLREALAADPADARAAYYLGNLLFDWQPDEAVALWKQSAAADPSMAIVHRNLVIAEVESRGRTGDVAQAIALLEKAVSQPKKYALHFAELDELYARAGTNPEKRLALLEQNHSVVSKRDDALSREIGLKIFAGKLDDAIALMTGRKFRVWEGGSLEVANHWIHAHLLRGQRNLAARRFDAALADFEAARTIPDNLPSDTRQGGGREAELLYWTGLTHEARGIVAEAQQSWKKSAALNRSTRSSLSEQLVQVYYSARARQKLGEAADETFRKLIESATEARTTSPSAEPPRRREGRRMSSERIALTHYIAGLAHQALGDNAEAKTQFSLALQTQPDALGPKVALENLK